MNLDITHIFLFFSEQFFVHYRNLLSKRAIFPVLLVTDILVMIAHGFVTDATVRNSAKIHNILL